MEVLETTQELYQIPFLIVVSIVISAQVAGSIVPQAKKKHSTLLRFVSIIFLAFFFQPLASWVVIQIFDLIVSSYWVAVAIGFFGLGIYVISKGNEK